MSLAFVSIVKETFKQQEEVSGGVTQGLAPSLGLWSLAPPPPRSRRRLADVVCRVMCAPKA